MQRSSGESRLVFAVRDGQTRLADIDAVPAGSCSPFREPPQAGLVTASGGVTGGDVPKMAIEVGPGGEVLVATHAAGKIYRASAASDPCTMTIAATVGEGAALDWLSREAIVFEGSRLKRRTVAEVAAGGSLLACEMVVPGRAASDVAFAESRILIRDNHVIVDMLRGPGAEVRKVRVPFDPEGGAYGQHNHDPDHRYGA
jgi:urease accessory protein